MQLSIFAITIPPRTPEDLHRKFAPTLGLLLGGGGGGDLFGFFYKRFLPFWNFHHNGKNNWRLRRLWGLFVALKFYTFLKKNFQS